MIWKWVKIARTTIHWIVLVLTVLYVVSGLGITHYSVVEQLTLGILTKSLSLRIHDNLLIPFLILLFLHVLLRLR